MSTAEEVREIPPSPLEIIEQFEEQHKTFLSVAQSTKAEPSYDGIQAILDRSEALKEASAPIFDSTFFHDSENPMIIDAGVGAIFSSGEEIAHLAYELAENGQTVKSFPEGSRDDLAASIQTGDVTPFIKGMDVSELDEDDLVNQLVVAYRKTYFELIDQLEEFSLNSDEIQGWLAERQDEMKAVAHREYERAEKIGKAQMIGGFFMAAVVGGVVANWINGRKA